MKVATKLRKVRDFDLASTLENAVADFADVPRGSSLATKAKAIAQDPRKLLIAVGVVVAFSLALGGLFAFGVLDAVYEAIYTTFPGRPWTHVMRDHPWAYLLLIVALIWIPFTVSPPPGGVGPSCPAACFGSAFLAGTCSGEEW